jgi:hydrogenase-1 operon protein HyaF
LRIEDIPIVAVGPGSQPQEADGSTLQYIDMPDDMWTYQRPTVRVEHGSNSLAGAREALAWLQQMLAGYQPDGEPRLADLSQLDDPSRTLLNELLGEGEVSVSYSGLVQARVQESVLAGIWRCHYLNDQGDVSHDLLEVGDVPHLVRMPDPQRQRPASVLADVTVPPGLMNAQPILTELAAHGESYRVGDPAHTINLSLLPMSDQDILFLDQVLGLGAVEILSRSYGRCLMAMSAIANIWWVRFYNSTGTLILNSLEVVDVPLVARAAVEDIAESGRRLTEILESEGLVHN